MFYGATESNRFFANNNKVIQQQPQQQQTKKVTFSHSADQREIDPYNEQQRSTFSSSTPSSSSSSSSSSSRSIMVARTSCLALVLSSIVTVLLFSSTDNNVPIYSTSTSTTLTHQTTTTTATAPLLALKPTETTHVSTITTTNTLSPRGQRIKMPRDDVQLFIKGVEDPYHPVDNPDGYLIMLVAENKLMWKEMAKKLQQDMIESPIIPQWTFNYGDFGGQVDFKIAMANMMKNWIDSPIQPDYLRFMAGAGSILEALSFALAEPNDGAIVAGPNYSAFAGDFDMFGFVKVHVAPTQKQNNYEPTIQELNECYQQSLLAGNPPKIFIICQPNNPIGSVYSKESMKLMITWALQKGLHVISDEIYALSVFPGVKTISAADIMSSEINHPHEQDELFLGDYVHIVAGLSKDWGMSGFRVGTLFTHNKQLLAAFDVMGYYQSVSQYTQVALTKVFNDDQWVKWYIQENQHRLKETFDALQDALDLINVRIYPDTKGGLFAWADFSSYLKPNQSGKELWLELFHTVKIIFTEGESFYGAPGMFRIVYTWPEGGVIAMKELGQRLVKWKNER